METRTKRTKTAVSVLVLAGLVVFGLTATGGNLEPSAPPGPTMKTLDEVEPRIPIQSLSGSGDALYIIDKPGSYYLTANVKNVPVAKNGINVEASDVTIDLMGYSLIGAEGLLESDYGIYAASVNNITVINGTVRDFGDGGIYLGGANNQLKNIKASDNDFRGIYANTSSTITDCTANNNNMCGIQAGSRCTIANCTANNSTYDGIGAGENSTLINCTANGNGYNGFYARYSSIINCTANQNGYQGFYGLRLSISNCMAHNNTQKGFYVDASTITNCDASYNGSDGMFVINKSTVSNCTVTDNSDDGIHAVSKCRIGGNNLRDNSNRGLYLHSDYNYAIKNTGSGNTMGNFVDNSAGNNYMPTTSDNANVGW